MYRTYVLTTETVDARARAEIGLSDVMVWDTERPYHYARWASDHRLLMGGADRRLRPGQRRQREFDLATRELRAVLRNRAAGTGGRGYAIRLGWSLCPHTRHAPVHRSSPTVSRYWFALGYGGNGMTFGYLAARLLVERWHGVRSPEHPLFEFDRRDGK